MNRERQFFLPEIKQIVTFLIFLACVHHVDQVDLFLAQLLDFKPVKALSPPSDIANSSTADSNSIEVKPSENIGNRKITSSKKSDQALYPDSDDDYLRLLAMLEDLGLLVGDLHFEEGSQDVMKNLEQLILDLQNGYLIVSSKIEMHENSKEGLTNSISSISFTNQDGNCSVTFGNGRVVNLGADASIEQNIFCLAAELSHLRHPKFNLPLENGLTPYIVEALSNVWEVFHLRLLDLPEPMRYFKDELLRSRLRDFNTFEESFLPMIEFDDSQRIVVTNRYFNSAYPLMSNLTQLIHNDRHEDYQKWQEMPALLLSRLITQYTANKSLDEQNVILHYVDYFMKHNQVIPAWLKTECPEAYEILIQAQKAGHILTPQEMQRALELLKNNYYATTVRQFENRIEIYTLRGRYVPDLQIVDSWLAEELSNKITLNVDVSSIIGGNKPIYTTVFLESFMEKGIEIVYLPSTISVLMGESELEVDINELSAYLTIYSTEDQLPSHFFIRTSILNDSD